MPTLVTDRVCLCQCHRHGYGYYAAYRDDIVEAALACPCCIDAHCPALLSHAPWPYHRREPHAPPAYTGEGEE